MFFMPPERYILKIILLLFIGVSVYGYGQSKKYDSEYALSFKNVGTDSYTSTLIKHSETKPDKNWNNYKGREIHTDDSLFFFGDDKLSKSFPTNCSKINNKYLIYYYSQKSSKCPTLFSLHNFFKSNSEDYLKEKKLPKELALIPVVCSAYNPHSSNKIGGYGHWHLNHPQAVKYGLIVNEYIDERKNWEKSTKAAINYLSDLYRKYNNWELTLAAYSSGVVNIRKLLNRSKEKTYAGIADKLPDETKDFVQAFVAMNYIYNYDSYGAVKLSPMHPIDSVTFDKKVMFKAINDVAKIKTIDYYIYNHSLTQEVFPKGFVAFFDKKDALKIRELKDSIYYYQDSILLKPEPKEPEFVIPKDGDAIQYTVRSGDVLGLIASRFNVKVSQIQAWNNLSGTRINIGQKLMIYGKPKKKEYISKSEKEKKQPEKQKKEPKETTKPNISFNSGKYTTYTVKSGDNLWLIAKKFSGVSAQNIMDFNGIDANLDVGQVLKIPKP